VTGEPVLAYSVSAPAWHAGPSRIYDRLAERLLDQSPVPLEGALVVDLGAGTGAASRAALARGARVIAVDRAEGMVRFDRAARPPAVVADALALPLADRSVDVVAAAFSINHLGDQVGALAEAGRVLRRGGALVASAYADDDSHPVKAAVDTAAGEAGWQPPPWLAQSYAHATNLATEDAAARALVAAGLPGEARRERLAFPDLAPDDLVAWRLGMAQTAPFVQSLAPKAREALVARALAVLGDAPPLVRSVIVMVARRGEERPQ
jgi:SAM-dependent methyltransferase